MGDMEKIELIMMPISSDKILFGSKKKEINIDIDQFNYFSAQCSYNFFVARDDGDNFFASVIIWCAISDRGR